MPEGPGGAAGKAALPALAAAANPAGSSAGRRELRKGVLAGALGALLAAGTLLHAVDFWEATECDLDGQLHPPPVHDLGPAAAPAEVQPGEEVTWRARRGDGRGGGREGGVGEAADRRSPPPVPPAVAVAGGGAAGPGEERLVVPEAAGNTRPADAVRLLDSLRTISTAEQKGKWPEELPFAALRRSLVATGRRSHEFARKLRTGQPVTIAVVGGSVSNQPMGCKGACSTATSWINHLHSYLVRRFPNAHKVQNSGLGGVMYAYMALCYSWHVPQDADLVFVEYAVNDQPPTDGKEYPMPQLAALERLIRSLLKLPRRPAVVLFNVFKWEKFWGEPVFWRTPEDEMNILGQYYDLGSVSMRNAFWHLTADPASPFSGLFFLPEGRRGDLTHPNPRGHEYLAQMAAFWVEKALQEQLAEDGLLEPEPAALGPPMWAGNYERNGTLCFIDKELGRIVAGKAGFDWRVEGRPEKPKPGFVGLRPGDWIEFAVRTPAAASGRMTVELGVLRSYEHMGRARVGCTATCRCEELEVDAHHAERSSQVYTEAFGIEAGKACTIRVEILAATSSPDGEHKFKVATLMIRDGDGKDKLLHTVPFAYTAGGTVPWERDRRNGGPGR